MRKLILIYLVLFSCSIFAQDTLVYRSGEKQVAKITEVNISEIKFKKTNNLGGPLYSEVKNKIAFIKYANGTIDSIPYIAEVAAVPPPVKVISQPSLMYLRISDRDLLWKINTLPSSDKKNKIKMEYALMKHYQRNQYLANGLGLGIGFAVPVVCTYYAFYYSYNSYGYNSTGVNQEITILVGALAGAAIRITGQVLTKINKNKRLNARRNIIRMYDELN